MILVENDFLNAEQLQFLRELFSRRAVTPGTESAGTQLTSVKNNHELDVGEHREQVKQVVNDACNRSALLRHALLPRTVSDPILSVYETGMYYGTHTDSAFWKEDRTTYRSDISGTVFLDDPDSYDGGELVIETEYGRSSFKLPAGDVVFYPTLFLHQVTKVARGRRRACVFWVESLVRDPQKRSMLFDLVQIGNWLAERAPIESPARQALTRVRENLFRDWIES